MIFSVFEFNQIFLRRFFSSPFATAALHSTKWKLKNEMHKSVDILSQNMK